MAWINKFLSFIVERQMEKSGQLDQLREQLEAWPRVEWSSDHELFRELWDDIVPNIWDDDRALKRFYMDFQFRIIASIWPDLKTEEANEVVDICAKYYDESATTIKKQIRKSRSEFPNYRLEDTYLEKIPNYIELLSDTYTIFEDGRDYTFAEALSLMPEELNYPQDYAIEILASLGFTRENVNHID